MITPKVLKAVYFGVELRSDGFYAVVSYGPFEAEDRAKTAMDALTELFRETPLPTIEESSISAGS